jgi:predicted DNA-binding transcriptional regulator
MTKEEQLKKVFETILKDYGIDQNDINVISYLLLREVKIRTDLRG